MSDSNDKYGNEQTKQCPICTVESAECDICDACGIEVCSSCSVVAPGGYFCNDCEEEFNDPEN